MALARTNRKLVEQLRLGLDIHATQSALDRGAITPGQAKNIVKWIVGVKDIHDNPIYPVADATGQYVGQIATKNKGASWIARRYGENFCDESAEFTDKAQAVAYVRDDSQVQQKEGRQN